MTKDTDYYLKKISDKSNTFGDKLLLCLSTYKKSRLADLTLEEVKEFYEQLCKDKE